MDEDNVYLNSKNGFEGKDRHRISAAIERAEEFGLSEKWTGERDFREIAEDITLGGEDAYLEIDLDNDINEVWLAAHACREMMNEQVEGSDVGEGYQNTAKQLERFEPRA